MTTYVCDSAYNVCVQLHTLKGNKQCVGKRFRCARIICLSFPSKSFRLPKCLGHQACSCASRCRDGTLFMSKMSFLSASSVADVLCDVLKKGGAQPSRSLGCVRVGGHEVPRRGTSVSLCTHLAVQDEKVRQGRRLQRLASVAICLVCRTLSQDRGPTLHRSRSAHALTHAG